MKYILIFFVILCNFPLSSQSTVFAEKYKDYPELSILDEVRYKVDLKKGKLIIEKDVYKESIILTEKGLTSNTESFYYSDLLPVISYDAYTITKAGKKITVTQAAESSGKQDFVFHDDVKKTKLSYSGLEPGAKKVLTYKMQYKDPALIDGKNFVDYQPSEKMLLEVICDNEVELGHHIVNDPNGQIAFSKKIEGNKTRYTWLRSNQEPIKYESNTPGYLHFMPHVVMYIKSYKDKEKVTPFLGTVDLLHKQYTEYIKGLNVSEDSELKAISLDLTKNITEEEQKVKAIYYWVKQNIKYIAFESGYEGFIPRQAATVYERKFGDCKDMASIINAMCKYAGIANVHLVWIGTREIPYSYHQIPTPACDNHMIAAYLKGNDEIIYLDATDSQSRYGMPSAFIQGKEALLHIDEKSYKVVKVPIVTPDKNLIHRSLNLTMVGTKLIGKGIQKLDGYVRGNTINLIGDAVDQKRLDRIKAATSLGNNKYALLNYKEENLEDIDKPYTMYFDFEISNYIIQAGNETYINLALAKPFEKDALETSRNFDYDLDYLRTYKNIVTLELPAGKEIANLPLNHEFENDVLKSKFNYQKSGNKITLDYEVILKKIQLSKSDFNQWNEGITQLKKQYGEVIVLKGKS